ncbi:ankyrin repeat domain-containing protein [Delftia sp. DS1230]|uniref:ankyrin repeat domain-containing protein n=1 Tax=Delftia sp. DS1230 TaxID=3153805 RepID=UPI0032D9A139
MGDISALMKAIDDGQITEVRRLLEAGVDANAMDEEGQSPLMAAACANNVKALDLLLQYGADVRRAYADGWTALHMAVDFSIDSTIQRGGDLGDEPLDAILWLLAHGADVSAETERGETAVDFARAYRSGWVEQVLLRSQS